MGFNYSMQGKTPQQQAIVRKREEEDERRKQERDKQNKIVCKPAEQEMDYRAVVFEQGVRTLLELRVSGTAVANQPCGLDEETIYQWLEKVGSKHVEKNQQFERVLIASVDVENGKMKTEWSKLTRV
ncbi:hypothetical protein D1B33_07540 [Lysinibacillus yapensis]|uniref:Uncharacterized protein n=1 Tax=Ureibacillus yapensis TaxID=2304605 RepID=A0A396SI12_9BACL|nr:hypothetical protein [Lysinibacillus yapensis]RHW38717.1 hypothetical protein D1B33_07540 [Lysinibacillus yapensis]